MYSHAYSDEAQAMHLHFVLVFLDQLRPPDAQTNTQTHTHTHIRNPWPTCYVQTRTTHVQTNTQPRTTHVQTNTQTHIHIRNPWPTCYVIVSGPPTPMTCVHLRCLFFHRAVGSLSFAPAAQPMHMIAHHKQDCTSQSHTHTHDVTPQCDTTQDCTPQTDCTITHTQCVSHLSMQSPEDQIMLLGGKFVDAGVYIK
jgi:hypothetical protein